MNSLLTLGFNDKFYQVLTDGQALWVNHSKGCSARFSKAGFELVVSDIKKPIVSSPKTPNQFQWSRFRRLLSECFGLYIDDAWKPEWLHG